MTAKQKAELLDHYRHIGCGNSDPRSNALLRLANLTLMTSVLQIQYADNRGEIVPGVLGRQGKPTGSGPEPGDAYVVAQIRGKTGLSARVARRYPGLIELWRARINAYRGMHRW